MEFVPTAIADVVLVKPRKFGDARGFFIETWQREKFRAAGINAEFVQDNHSRSSRHILRGLHYQIKQTQGKLVRVTRGSVYDVVVDIRRSSPTYGRWIAEELNEDNCHCLWVPPGLAHGFLGTSDLVDFVYKCTDFYAPQYERSIAWNDPALAIPWPLPPGVAPQLSAKDAAAPTFAEAEHFP